MTPFETLEVAAAALPNGQSLKIVCPKCHGGTSGEVSLSLTRNDCGIAWICFRASCGYKGNPRGVSGVTGTPKVKEPRPFTHPYGPLDFVRRVFLRDRFEFIPRDRVAYWPDGRRYVLKVMGPTGDLRGVQAYSFEPGVDLKVLTYCERVDEQFIHWTSPYGDATALAPTVIVEDWFSAEKVAAAGGRGCALLGTHLNRERVEEIAKIASGNAVFLALDRDAFAKAVKYAAEYGNEFSPPLRVWRLARDLKYETFGRIKDALFNGLSDFTPGVAP